MNQLVTVNQQLEDCTEEEIRHSVQQSFYYLIRLRDFTRNSEIGERADQALAWIRPIYQQMEKMDAQI